MLPEREKERNVALKINILLDPNTTTIFTGSDLLGKLWHIYLEIDLNYRN